MKNFADKIFYNGRIHTIDPQSNILSAMALKNGKIIDLATKENEDLMIKDHYEEGHTVLEDLNLGIIFPGFIDSHVHAPGLGYDILFNVNLFDASSKEEVLELIRKQVEDHPEKKLYYGRGVNSCYFEGEESIIGPRKEHLDGISKNKPIIIADYGGNYLWMNSIAFKEYGITSETLCLKGGEISLDPKDGSLWGVIRGEARAMIPYQKFTEEENYIAGKWFQDQMLSYGYTSILALRPPGTVEPRTTLFPIFKALEKNNQLFLRVQGGKDMDPNGDIDEQIDAMKKDKAIYDSEQIQFTTAKFFLDGVIEGLDGCLLEPYSKVSGKGPDYKGVFIWEEEKLAYAFQRCMEAGFQIHCHSIGDGATHKALNAIEKAKEQLPKGDYRNTITHLQLVAKDDIKRMKANDIIGNLQVYWHFKSPAIYRQIEEPLLEGRGEEEYPLQSFIKEGILIVASSDYPVTSDPNPFAAIQAGVTRNLYSAAKFGLEDIKDADEPQYLLNKNERASLSDMIKAFTINPAYSRFQEDVIGSLELGKEGDFILLNKDPYEVNSIELETIKVMKTYFKGELVYSY